MTVRTVDVHADVGEVVLALVDDVDGTVLPVTIGPREGAAIASALAGIAPPRPLTHDLLLTLVRAAGGEVAHVEIVALRHGVFFAEVVLDDGARVDSRASDAVAIALRADVAVLCAPDVLAAAGERPLDHGGHQGSSASTGAPGESELAEFRAFLDRVEPEDFGDADS
ncbi:bifunctional nuclease family protein [Litorihabitans aurantiacus]|nr:bifunctional nuclease family protein [Litorihabitans aurantiacus]